MIKKALLGSFLLLILVGGYFYIFPTYPDYGIPDEYFETRHFDKEYDSEKNGFLDLKELTSFLNEQEVILGFQELARCIPLPNHSENNSTWTEGYSNNCFYLDRHSTVEKILEDYTSEEISRFSDYISHLEETQKLGDAEEIKRLKETFLSDSEKQKIDQYKEDSQRQKSMKKLVWKRKIKGLFKDKQLIEIREKYYEYLKNISSKEYVYSFDKSKSLQEGHVILFTHFIEYQKLLNLIMISYIENNEKEEAVSLYIENHSHLVSIYNNLDGNLIEHLAFGTILHIQQNMGKYILDTYELSLESRSKLQEVFSQEIYGEIGIQNGFKREYHDNISLLFEATFDKEEIGLKAILFLSEKETRNLIKHQFKQHINNQPILKIKWNGRNLIGRILVQMQSNSYTSYFKKAQALETKRKMLLDLLSY